ncbi:unnamed protein product [Soboliphyme baturini]|uniref:FNIP_C domain-containing protein n=1 Tax=Soboliphyme baturini TaxID=241478 RepID=A0A183J9N8_9BILA|nr:unnamed protein product [Soboliphyme baturini]
MIEDMSVSEVKSPQCNQPHIPWRKADDISNDAFNPGVSLQAGFTERYCPYFTLSGLNYSPDIYLKVQNDIKSLVSTEMLSPEPIIEAVCVLANTCDW